MHFSRRKFCFFLSGCLFFSLLSCSVIWSKSHKTFKVNIGTRRFDLFPKTVHFSMAERNFFFLPFLFFNRIPSQGILSFVIL